MSAENDFERQHSHQNLKFMAKQLAINYFNASTVDLFPELKTDKEDTEHRKKINDIGRELVFNIDKQKGKNDIFSVIGYCSSKNKDVDEKRNNPFKVHRNILVMGAGCSYNSFANIPLGGQTIDLIKRNITIISNDDLKISFDYFIRFNECFPKMDSEDYPLEDSNLNNKKANRFLYKQLKQEFSLLSEIGRKYTYEERRQKLINNSDIDFEAFLHILEQILPKATIKETLQNIYNMGEGVNLNYSIIAHLFKNRFIDIIINFNFDELLDRAIDEELGHTGYDKILSDGDCKPIKDISIDKRLRQPLYIKPHGTASHKSTLRFTKNQYHELPLDMRNFIGDLISCEKEEPDRPVNLITMGFNMESIEFNEILANKLNPKSSIFNIFFHSPNTDFKREAKKVYDKVKGIFSFDNNIDSPNIFLIGSEFYSEGSYSFNTSDKINLRSEDCSLGNFSKILFENILRFFNQLYEPRNIHKHNLLSNIFGNRRFWNQDIDKKDYIPVLEKINKDPDTEENKPSTKRSYYPKSYFRSADYYKDRVLIEILINLTINSGNFNLLSFIKEGPGYYYSNYYNKTEEGVLTFDNMLSQIGISRNQKHLLHSYDIRTITSDYPSKNPYRRFLYFFDNFVQEIIKNENNLFSQKLSSYFHLLENEITDRKTEIRENLLGLLKSDNSKILPNFRNNEYHIFKNYSTSYLINTNLLNDLHFHYGLEGGGDLGDNLKINTICIVADNGYQISKFLSKIIRKYENNDGDFKIYLIAHDAYNGLKTYEETKDNIIEVLKNSYSNTEQPENIRTLKNEILEIMLLPIKDHNRHMVLFMDYDPSDPFIDQSKNVSKAIYYYKRGLSQKINPIELNDPENKEYALKMFEYYSKKAVNYHKELPADNPDLPSNWIHF